MEREGKGGTCNQAAKSAPIEGAGMPCKGKGAGERKEVEKSRRR